MTIRMLAIITAVSLLAACSTKMPPSFGEQLASKSAATEAIAKKWQSADATREKGARLIADGNKDLAKAQKNMNKANANIQKGQEMVTASEVAMREAEDAMRAVRAAPIEIPTTPMTIQPTSAE